MRVYKYIFFTILTLLCTVMCADIFLTSIEFTPSFFYNIRFKFSQENTQSTLEMIDTLSEKHNVSVFIQDIYYDNYSQIRSIFYADEKSADILQNNYRFHEGKYRGGFSARYDYVISFEPINVADGKLQFLQYICLIGEDGDVKAFVNDFTDLSKAAFGEDTSAYFDGKASTPWDMNFRHMLEVWLVILAILLSIVLFEVAIIRKEAVVGCINGRSIAGLIFKRLAVDLLVYTIILAAISLSLWKIGTPPICFAYTWGAMAVLMIGSLLAYLTLYFSNIKATLGGVRQGVKILYFNYFVKLIAVMGCFIFFLDIVNLIQDNQAGFDTQETMEKYFDGYCYSDVITAAEMSGEMSEDEFFEMKSKIYEEHYDDLKPLNLSCNVTNSGKYIVHANAYALEYLSSIVPELKNAEKSSRFIVAVKKGDKDHEQYAETFKQMYKGLYGADALVVNYESSVDVMCLDADTNTRIEYAHDPMISILCIDQEIIRQYGSAGVDYTVLQLDKEKIAMLCNEYKLREQDMAICDVRETFERQWGVGKAAIISNVTIEAVVLLVVLIISLSVFKFTFIAKAKELCIKKICGHGLLARYAKTCIASLAVYIPAYLYARHLDKDSSWSEHTVIITIFTIIVIAVDMLVSIPYIIKTEKANVSKTLKGGAL